MSRFARRCWATFGVIAMLVLGLQAGAASADPPDFSAPGEAFNILPPGQFGTLPTTVHSRDQLFMYDALTPLKDNVKQDQPEPSRRQDHELLGPPGDRRWSRRTSAARTGRRSPRRPGLVGPGAGDDVVVGGGDLARRTATSA